MRAGDEAGRLFFCCRKDRWEDSWTYGNWRQWICKRGDRSRCARVIISLPGWALMWAVGPMNDANHRVMYGDRA